MKKSIKKLLAFISSAAIAATMITVPVTAGAEGTTWKFDFGTAEAVEDGWIAVTAADVYAENASKSPVQYGFLGTDGHGNSYGQHVDGVVTKEGQNVTLKAGGEGNTASDDYLGVDKEATVAESKIDGDYPIRFAMKAESDAYYNVKVKLTTFDKEAGATATVFSERHHAIILEEAMTAGEEKLVEFNTTIQPYYLKDPQTTYNDDMLNVVVVGDNVAVESIEIEKLTEQLPTVWMYNDSTGCDYQISQPFFMLQNYGGTGSFLSKYFPKGIVAVNQGEGGLNAADNLHWNAANSHIGASDYVYVQYGHNHKNDSTVAPGTLGYLESIPKYYQKAHAAGAYTLYVGPIDRHNDGQYNDATNTWSSTLGGFSKAAKYYTEILITAGPDKAAEFVTKARTDSSDKINIDAATYTWADEIIKAGIKTTGVTDVAFVDLNQPTLDWLKEVCETVKTIRGADKYESNASDYYFYSQKGEKVDGTHCNTAGADNTASFFFDEAAKTIALASSDSADAKTKAIAAVEAAVLSPLVTGMRTTTDNAYVIPEDIIRAGAAPNSMWPTVYVPSNLPALPLVIKDIQFGEDGRVSSATLYRQAAEKNIATYGILDIEIKTVADGETKGHIYSRQIEPTGTNGANFTIEEFTTYNPENLTFDPETDTYTAVVRSASDTPGGIVIDTGDNADTYSAVYVPTDIDTMLLEDDFDYYGASTGANIAEHGWGWIGSGAADGAHMLTKGDVCYTEINASGGGSFYLWRDFDKTGDTVNTMTNTGKYMFEGSFNYTSGGGSVVSLVTGTNDKNRSGTARLPLFTIGANGAVTVGETSTAVADSLIQGKWVDIRAIVDTDLGTLSVSVGGGTPATVDLANYQTTATKVEPEKLTQIHFGKDRMAYSYKVTNLRVAKLKRDTLPSYTLNVSANNSAAGTVEIKEAANPATATAEINTVMTVVAKPNENYVLENWTDGSDKVVSTDREYTFRLRDNLNLTANFAKQGGVEDVKSFVVTANKQLIKAGSAQTVEFTISDVFDASGNPVDYTDSDIKVTAPSTVTASAASKGVVEVTIPKNYEIAADTVKDVTVKFTINNIDVNYTISVYSYEFYENVKNGKLTASYEGVSDKVNNRDVIRVDENATKTLTLPEAVKIGDKTTITFKASYLKGCGQVRSIEFYSSDNKKIVNELLGICWSALNVGGTIKSDNPNRGAEVVDPIGKFDNAAPAGSWSNDDITITLNKSTGKGTVNFANGTPVEITLDTAAADIKSIKLIPVSGAGADRMFGITDLTIKNEASQTPPDPEVTLGYNGTNVTINSNTDYSGALLVTVIYDSDGMPDVITLDSVDIEADVEKTVAKTINADAKIMLWDSVNGMQPLADAYPYHPAN